MVAMTSLNLATASSFLPALLRSTPSVNALFIASAFALALAASSFDIPPPAPPPLVSLKSRLAMSRWMSMSCAMLRSPFDAVTLYLAGERPTWMYSPFLLVFVSRVRLLFVLYRVILAPSSGLPSGSTTLPLICPVWAETGAATIARQMAMAQIESVRRMVAPVMTILQFDRADPASPPLILYRP